MTTNFKFTTNNLIFLLTITVDKHLCMTWYDCTEEMVTVMLVISLCWWLYDGDWFQMLVKESLWWRLFSLCWLFSQCIKSVINILNRSPTSQICHQHIWSPTSVTNIDITSSEYYNKLPGYFIKVASSLWKNHWEYRRLPQTSSTVDT